MDVSASPTPADVLAGDARRIAKKRHHVRVNVALGSLLVLFLLLATTVVAYRVSDGWVDHTYRVQSTLQHLLQTITDAETNQRGYILTRDRSYLPHYESSVERTHRLLDDLERLMADNAAQQIRIAEIRPLVNRRLDALALALAASEAQGIDAAVNVIREAHGRDAMMQAQDIIAAMGGEEARLLDRREWIAKGLFGLLVVLLALFIVIAAWISLSGVRQIERDYQVERAAAEAKEALLYEVNHRVKNSLLLVTSLLALQARQTGVPELKESLSTARRRVEVVAKMHQRLYESGQHNRVELASFLRDLVTDTVAALDSEGRITLDFALENGTSLGLNRAVPLALIVNELVTNAVKYAFTDRERGAIKIALNKPIAGTAQVTVADNGKGLPEGFDPARSSGLGMRVVANLVRQIRATLQYDREGPGACFRIAFPTEA